MSEKTERRRGGALKLGRGKPVSTFSTSFFVIEDKVSSCNIMISFVEMRNDCSVESSFIRRVFSVAGIPQAV